MTAQIGNTNSRTWHISCVDEGEEDEKKKKTKSGSKRREGVEMKVKLIVPNFLWD